LDQRDAVQASLFGRVALRRVGDDLAVRRPEPPAIFAGGVQVDDEASRIGHLRLLSAPSGASRASQVASRVAILSGIATVRPLESLTRVTRRSLRWRGGIDAFPHRSRSDVDNLHGCDSQGSEASTARNGVNVAGRTKSDK